MKLFSKKSVTAVLSAAALLFTSCDSLADDVLVEPSDWSEGVMETPYYLMSSIGANMYISSDSLHLAWSDDGLTWTAFNSNGAVQTTNSGSNHYRDPSIFRLNDGTFVLLAADFTSSGEIQDLGSRSDLNYWGHPKSTIYVAFSNDLINWTKGHFLKLTEGTGKDGAVRHCWSPRAVYNKQYKCYDIYWIGDNEEGVNEVYLTQTYDFYSVKSLKDNVIYSPGCSVINAAVVKSGSSYYLFARDDDVDFATGSGGDIQVAKSERWGKGFTRISSDYINRVNGQFTPENVMYPCVYKLKDNNTWVMHVNKKNDPTTFSTYVTTDISDTSSWKAASAADPALTFTLPGANIDTSVVMITQEEFDALDAVY
ncbi:hypothetical protein HNP77_001940 [Treponema rectale]|uniref:Glycosyl hydrolase family 32 N-terminal domain-containing protein n=1 Tax=Treponema rectale TaxID=744512 RepID=A0A840SHC2_9SPIR|nr:hypothetical protein [Treponema rectale]MBB5219558.1 hypothetical protein [Treponema rectale]